MIDTTELAKQVSAHGRRSGGREGRRVMRARAVPSLPALVRKGLRHLRVEFLHDGPEAVARVLGLYRDALDGRRDARTLWKELKATNRYGVTRGQLAVL